MLSFSLACAQLFHFAQTAIIVRDEAATYFCELGTLNYYELAEPGNLKVHPNALV